MKAAARSPFLYRRRGVGTETSGRWAYEVHHRGRCLGVVVRAEKEAVWLACHSKEGVLEEVGARCAHPTREAAARELARCAGVTPRARRRPRPARG